MSKAGEMKMNKASDVGWKSYKETQGNWGHDDERARPRSEMKRFDAEY